MTRTITGDPAFDRTITAPAEGDKLRREGSENNPFKAGLFQTVTDVSWTTGQFTFCSSASPHLFNFWSVAALSKDGVQWDEVNTFINDPSVVGLDDNNDFRAGGPATNLGVNVRGLILDNQDTWLAAGIRGHEEPDSLGNEDIVARPIVMYSADQGAEWVNAEMPDYPVGGTQLIDASPFLVAYNSKEKTFYVTSTYRKIGSGFSTLTVTQSWDGGGWSTIDVQDFSANAANQPLSLPIPPKSKVASLVEIINKNYKFVSSAQPNQLLHTSDSDGNKRTVAWKEHSNVILVDGQDVAVPSPMDSVESVACGKGIIMVAGFDLNVSNEIHMSSSDMGGNWEEISQLVGILGGEGLAGFSPCFSFS
jgi:hypothetical protein